MALPTHERSLGVHACHLFRKVHIDWVVLSNQWLNFKMFHESSGIKKDRKLAEAYVSTKESLQ